MLTNEPEILDGSRAWEKTQELFRGLPDRRRQLYDATCGWYEPPTSIYEGAFAIVREDGPLEGVVGEFVEVEYEGRRIYVYVTGGTSGITEDLALYRYPFLKLADAARRRIVVNVAPLEQA